MDQIVLDALVKWPNVPACTGWLLLDRRGQWRMRDDACQAAGLPGEPIRHVALNAFISRNYAADKEGRWFFQNGPQRVFVDLAYTPFVVRLHEDADPQALAPRPSLIDQCGQPFQPQTCWYDDAGQILFTANDDAALRVALLHDHDLILLSERLQWDTAGQPVALEWPQDSMSCASMRIPVQQIAASQVPGQFGFVRQPAS